MKPLPPPRIEGKTDWERFDNALKTVLKVPKEAVLKKEAAEKNRKERATKKKHS